MKERKQKTHLHPIPPSELNLTNIYQQLCLQNKLPLLILFGLLIGLIILPSDNLLALFTRDIAHNVAARCHVPLHGLGLLDVYDRVEEVCFSVLAAEIL